MTGNFAKKAYKEAQKYGDVRVAASSEDKNFTYIPDFDDSSFRSDIDYVHCTSNNTIYGSRMRKFPSVETLVCDMSSNILSEVYDVSKFGVIYAGAQKNISCAGVTVVIVRKDLLDQAMPICPTMLKWSTQAKDNSLYNTPPCFSIYIASLTLKWLKNLGGVPAIQKINEEKAKMLYDYIDNSGFYTNPVRPEDRSMMNVPSYPPRRSSTRSSSQARKQTELWQSKGTVLSAVCARPFTTRCPSKASNILSPICKNSQLNTNKG